MVRNLSRGIRGTLVVACAAAMALPAGLAAQTKTLSWTETTKVEVPGALGLMLRAMPGGMEQKSQQTMHLQGRTLIQEDGKSATVMDLENRRHLWIDHEAKTYVSMTFEESAQAAAEMSRLLAEAMAESHAELEEARAQQEEAMEELRRSMEEARASLSFRISSDATGRTQNFGAAGTATQHFVLAELEGTAAPEGVEEVEEGGTMVFLVELWQSRDLPSADAFYEEWARGMADDPAMRALAAELAESAETAAGAATALAMWDPRVSAGLTEVAEAMERIDGTTVKSVVTIAMLPLGVNLDRDALVAWQPAGMGQVAGAAARDAAAGAARGAVRGLTGRLGARGGQQQAEPEARPATMQPVMRMTTTKENVVYRQSNDDVMGPLMQRIQGYQQFTLADLMQQAQQP